jgi:hypothetical protein
MLTRLVQALMKSMPKVPMPQPFRRKTNRVGLNSTDASAALSSGR